MDTKLCIAFNATETQINELKKFVSDKKNNDKIVVIRQGIDDDISICLSMCLRKPEIYFGLYSRVQKRIVTDREISEREFQRVIERMELKYAHAMSRENPLGDKELVIAWMNYFNAHAGEKAEIEISI